MLKKLITIIVPVYNVEKYIRRCVDSLIMQTYHNLEIILVDDGSTDDSSIICDDYADRDNRINVIHKKNGGLSDARNAGLDLSTGDYIMFIDSDDYVDHNLIDRVFLEAEKNNADVVVCGYYADYVDKEEKLISTTIYAGLNSSYKKENFNEIPLSENVIGLLGYAWNKLYKSTIIKHKCHYFEKGLSLVEDIVFNCHVLEECESIIFIGDSLVHYMQRPRETLGSKFYDNYFELNGLKMEAVNNLLLSWRYKEEEIIKITNLIGFRTLKSIVYLLSQSSNYDNNEKNVYLLKLLKEDKARKILTHVKINSFKDKIICLLLLNKQTKLLLNIYMNITKKESGEHDS